MRALPSPDALRFALAAAERHGVGRAYPERLRRAAIEFTRLARDRGETFATIAATLGLPAITVQRWLSRDDKSAFRAALVVEGDVSAAFAAAPIVVHGPGGIRIEGLDVAGV